MNKLTVTAVVLVLILAGIIVIVNYGQGSNEQPSGEHNVTYYGNGGTMTSGDTSYSLLSSTYPIVSF